MKLDQTLEKGTATMQVSAKKREGFSSSVNSGSILELLNPLKSININSELNPFYNFRESKESIEALLRAQMNLVFYVIHQYFMCNNAHKEFFKNMVGRFYDLPEKFWDYYRGIDYHRTNNFYTMLGLILLENKNLYDRLIKYGHSVLEYDFKRIKSEEKIVQITHLNALCLEEYWGGEYLGIYSCYFVPYNKKNINDRDISNKRAWSTISFDDNYEFGRFNTTNCIVKRKTEALEENYWYIIDLDEIEKMDKFPVEIQQFVAYYAVYASIGLERKQEIVSLIKRRASELNLLFDDNWIPIWSKENEKLIRSLSQTFLWSKEYIYENEELLNLDVLGLNMTVPWDMDLVKFFFKRGYEGRMSENKAVFDRVFKPLLTDEILDMLFRLEYEEY